MSESTAPDDETIVTSLFTAAGFDPPADELAQLVAGYAATRAMVQMLYAVPEARYEIPALHYDPTAIAPDWA